MPSIYELTEEMTTLQRLLEDPDYDDEMVKNTLEGVEMELEMKADAYARIMKNLSAEAEGIHTEEKRLYERRKALENNVNNLKKNLEAAMIATGKTKFKTELFSFGIQKNPASLKIDADIMDIPDEYVVYKAEPNNEKIKADLKDGKELAFAHLEQSESIRIR